MAKTNKNDWMYWFVVGLIALLVAAPSTTVMRVVLGYIDPTTYNTLRAGICFLVAVPFIFWHWRKLNRQNFVYALGAGICTSIAFTVTTYAIKDSQASYVVIMSLLSPIILVLYSGYFFHEKVKFQAAAGVTLAALGTFVAVVLPLVIGGKTRFDFYPMATVLMIVNSLFFPLAVIFLRKANESKLPLTSTQGISAAVVMIVSFAISFAIHGQPINLTAIPSTIWLAIAYSAIVVIFIVRILSTASYEHIGSVATSGLNYLSTIVSLLTPILFLNEKLSNAMIFGGVLILVGVYFTERHKSSTHHYWHLLHHH